jgi:hypothetical protein
MHLTSRLFRNTVAAVSAIENELKAGQSCNALFHVLRIYRGPAVDELVYVDEALKKGEKLETPEYFQKLINSWVTQVTEANAEKLVFSVSGMQYFIRKSSIDAMTYEPKSVSIAKPAQQSSPKDEQAAAAQ